MKGKLVKGKTYKVIGTHPRAGQNCVYIRKSVVEKAFIMRELSESKTVFYIYDIKQLEEVENKKCK